MLGQDRPAIIMLLAYSNTKTASIKNGYYSTLGVYIFCCLLQIWGK